MLEDKTEDGRHVRLVFLRMDLRPGEHGALLLRQTDCLSRRVLQPFPSYLTIFSHGVPSLSTNNAISNGKPARNQVLHSVMSKTKKSLYIIIAEQQ
jgi:hypothetical protein